MHLFDYRFLGRVFFLGLGVLLFYWVFVFVFNKELKVREGGGEDLEGLAEGEEYGQNRFKFKFFFK